MIVSIVKDGKYFTKGDVTSPLELVNTNESLMLIIETENSQVVFKNMEKFKVVFESPIGKSLFHIPVKKYNEFIEFFNEHFVTKSTYICGIGFNDKESTITIFSLSGQINFSGVLLNRFHVNNELERLPESEEEKYKDRLTLFKRFGVIDYLELNAAEHSSILDDYLKNYYPVIHSCSSQPIPRSDHFDYSSIEAAKLLLLSHIVDINGKNKRKSYSDYYPVPDTLTPIEKRGQKVIDILLIIDIFIKLCKNKELDSFNEDVLVMKERLVYVLRSSMLNPVPNDINYRMEDVEKAIETISKRFIPELLKLTDNENFIELLFGMYSVHIMSFIYGDTFSYIANRILGSFEIKWVPRDSYAVLRYDYRKADDYVEDRDLLIDDVLVFKKDDIDSYNTYSKYGKFAKVMDGGNI